MMPAIHKNAGQVASLFHDKLGVEHSRDVDQLIQSGRREIGLSQHGGIDHHGLVYLLDRVTTAKAV